MKTLNQKTKFSTFFSSLGLVQFNWEEDIEENRFFVGERNKQARKKFFFRSGFLLFENFSLFVSRLTFKAGKNCMEKFNGFLVLYRLFGCLSESLVELFFVE